MATINTKSDKKFKLICRKILIFNISTKNHRVFTNSRIHIIDHHNYH